MNNLIQFNLFPIIYSQEYIFNFSLLIQKINSLNIFLNLQPVKISQTTSISFFNKKFFLDIQMRTTQRLLKGR